MTIVASRLRWLLPTVILSTAIAGIASAGPQSRPNAAVVWNDIATQAFLPTQGSQPIVDSRSYAMIHAAIHDALNAIDRRYESHTPGLASAPAASPDAAVAAAAHGVLLALVPTQQPLIQSAYDAALDAIPDGPAEDRGVALGQSAAAAILARRLDDGLAEAFATPYVPTGLPGDYPFTPPFDVPPLGPLAAAPGWGALTPFGIDLDDHRLPGPDPIRSLAYAFDLASVRAIGDINSRIRTPDQSQIARFWYEDSPIGWNRIANIVLRQKNVGLWQAARILALVNFAMADGFIAGFDAKYHFRFWRPITAIRQAAFDGNPWTHPDEDWTPMLITPPVPDYPSTHTVLGASAAAVLIHFFGDRVRFRTTSVTEPGVTRTFTGFSHAAVENGLSRVFCGIHFLRAVADGYRQGTSIGRKVARLLPPVG